MRSGLGGADAVELAVDVLPLADRRRVGEESEFLCEVFAVEIGRADFDRDHAEFHAEKAGEGNFKL